MCTVLVIDDERMIQWSMEQTLGAAGHTVVTAGTVAEGQARLLDSRPDVVFLDVRLPDGDGLDMLERLQAEDGQRPAVIVMTAFDEGGIAEQALRLGARAYMKKPFDFAELHALVDQALQA